MSAKTILSTLVTLIATFLIVTAFLAFLYFTDVWKCPLTYACYKMWNNFITKLMKETTGTETSTIKNSTIGKICDVYATKCRVVYYQNGRYIIEQCREVKVNCVS